MGANLVRVARASTVPIAHGVQDLDAKRAPEGPALASPETGPVSGAAGASAADPVVPRAGRARATTTTSRRMPRDSKCPLQAVSTTSSGDHANRTRVPATGRPVRRATFPSSRQAARSASVHSTLSASIDPPASAPAAKTTWAKGG